MRHLYVVLSVVLAAGCQPVGDVGPASPETAQGTWIAEEISEEGLERSFCPVWLSVEEDDASGKWLATIGEDGSVSGLGACAFAYVDDQGEEQIGHVELSVEGVFSNEGAQQGALELSLTTVEVDAEGYDESLELDWDGELSCAVYGDFMDCQVDEAVTWRLERF